MRIKTIVLVMLLKHFEIKDYTIFGVDVMLQNGFQVEIWSTYKIVWGYEIEKPIRCYEGDNVYYFNNKHEIQEKIHSMNMKNTFFVIYPGDRRDDFSTFLKKCIIKNKGAYANYDNTLNVCNLNDLSIYEKKNNLKIFYEYVNSWKKNPIKFYDDVNMIVDSILYPCKFEFIQGYIGYEGIKNKFHRNSRKIVLMHSEDYDRIIKVRKMMHEKDYVPCHKGRYAVFIDQFLAGHSDFKKIGAKPPVTSPQRYYSELNRFFEMVEKQYECEVVIALHPKAEYKENPFDNRKMYMYKTDELILNASICIFHESTSFGMILESKVPFFQITTTDLKNSGRSMIYMYEKMGISKVCDISTVKQDELEQYIVHFDTDVHGKVLQKLMLPEKDSDELNVDKMSRLISEL